MKLSVIIPTRNRANILEKALNSLVSQTIDKEFFEVIIVDNGSTDNTKKVVDLFTEKIPNLIYIYDDNPGLHIGRHRGLLESKSDILVFGDDDIEALPTWLEAILESFEQSDVVLVGGKNIPCFEIAPPQWIKEMWEKGGNNKIISYLSILDFGEKKKEINPYYVFGCNFSIRKKILIEAGGFHPDGMPQELIKYRGDGESYISKFIQENGYRAVYNPKASVFHLVPTDRMTKKYFFQRAFNQGISDSYTDIRNNITNRLSSKKIKLFIKKYLLFKDVEIDYNYLSGFYYHQNEAKRDEKLMEWIKRESYINNGKIK